MHEKTQNKANPKIGHLPATRATLYSPSMKLFSLLLCLTLTAIAQDEETPRRPSDDPFNPATFAGLKLRAIGPAFTSGRVTGFAVHPDDPAYYFVAVASGGVWKTINNGASWTPVFDNQGSYSIGTVVLDPWRNMGLRKSEHIARIVIDPPGPL
jgi:hypothetical protein